MEFGKSVAFRTVESLDWRMVSGLLPRAQTGGGGVSGRSRAEIDRELRRERRLLRRHSSKDYRAWFKGRKRVASVEDLPYDEMLQRGEAVLLGGAQPAEFDLGRADKRARVR